jgi:predicted Rossmann-fold nucleotide-binding protein
VGLLNTHGYYDRLIDFAQHSVQQGFLNDWQLDLIRIGDDPDTLLRQLVQAAGWTPTPHLDAI